MSMLLVIRRADDLRLAVDAVNEFLDYRRRRFPETRKLDELLGIWLRHEVAADLPPWLWFARNHNAGVPPDERADAGAAAPSESSLGVRDSFSLSGLWSLCWIDGALLQKSKTAEERRSRILDALVKSYSTQPRAFLPVFDATEPRESVEAALQKLRAQHPELIFASWFIDDPEQGLVGPQSTP